MNHKSHRYHFPHYDLSSVFVQGEAEDSAEEEDEEESSGDEDDDDDDDSDDDDDEGEEEEESDDSDESDSTASEQSGATPDRSGRFTFVLVLPHKITHDDMNPFFTLSDLAFIEGRILIFH